MKIKLLALLLLFYNISNGQCISQGADSASVVVNDNYIGTLQWNNPMNAISADTTYSVAGSGFQLNLCTYFLKATSFGFSIPSTASICGIEVKVKRKLTDGMGRDSTVHIIQSGIITGSEHAYPIPWTFNDTIVTYGDSADLWYGGWPPTMIPWTPSLINDTTFGVAIACTQDWALTLFNIDQITMKVYYNNTIGISEANLVHDIKIFPNPFSAQTVLQTNNSFHNATLTVDNGFGQTVKEIKNINGRTVVLSRDNLASGLYFLRLTENNKLLAVDKLVISDK